MNITVSGKGVDVGESLRAHIDQRLTNGINKYLDRISQVNAVVSRESHNFRVDISANLGTHSGITIKSRADAGDIYACFDLAADKIEKQVRRYKRRLTNHHKEKITGLDMAEMPVKAKKYVLSGDDNAADQEDASAVIIAEKATDILTMSVSTAVMKMDLEDLPALLFFNSSHGRINVVYRRADGNISWVDPEVQEKEKRSKKAS